MTKEEFKDFYTEGSFAIRDAEVQFKLTIAKELGDFAGDEKTLELYAKAIKKHVGFLKECIGVAQHWLSIEKQYTKNMSWKDLVKLAGIEGEKRPRKSLKKIIEERKKVHEVEVNYSPLTRKDFIQGQIAEDTDLLKEV